MRDKDEACAIRVWIEFYRTRETDEAHATVGRETIDAANLADAIAIALQMARTLNMPQRPDALIITDEGGNQLYSTRLISGDAGKDPPHE